MSGSFFARGLRLIADRFSGFLESSREKKQERIVRVAGAAENLGLDEDHVAEDISTLKGEKHKRTVGPSEIQAGEEERVRISRKI